MDAFKIEHFESAGNSSFPAFRQADAGECATIRDKFLKQLGGGSTRPFADLLEKRQSFAGSIEDFGLPPLPALFETLSIHCLDSVYINWHSCRDGDIDELFLSDLSTHFYDIWYPSSDDIDIFDASLRWVVSVRHDGCVSACLFPVQLQ